MKNEKPSYYSIIPAPVRYDKKLTPNSKLLYAEITSLSNAHGFCYASNRYFANLYEVSIQSINNWLKQLEERSYIKRHVYRNKGTKEILNRYITIFQNPMQINFNRPIQDILMDNTTSNNSKPNIKLNTNKKKNKSKKLNRKNSLI